MDIMDVSTTPDEPKCSTRGPPWSHLMPGQRGELRNAYASLLRERVSRSAPAVPVPPPRIIDTASGSGPLVLVEGGCLLCGVSHQSVPATVVARARSWEQVARQMWTPKRTETQQLGGLGPLRHGGSDRLGRSGRPSQAAGPTRARPEARHQAVGAPRRSGVTHRAARRGAGPSPVVTNHSSDPLPDSVLGFGIWRAYGMR
jgi:hypothetical protein